MDAATPDALATAAAADDTRVFAFHPPPATPALRLAPHQRAQFARDGWCDPLPLLDVQELATVRAGVDRLLQLAHETGRGSYGVENWHRTARTLYDLALHPAVVDMVEDLLGPDIVCWSTHCFCKDPGDARVVSWHQDAPYWPLTPTRTVTAWVAIDAVDAENGAMQAIPGTHRLGRLPLRSSTPEEGNVLWLTTCAPERFGAPRTLCMPAGSVSFHADLLLHGSPANRSTRRRCAVALRYAAAAVRPLAGTGTAIHVRGRIGSHWLHAARPTDDQAPSPG